MSHERPPLNADSFLKTLPLHDDEAPLSAQRAALHLIQKELRRLKSPSFARLDALRREREQVAGSLTHAVYPVLTLPNEITSDIFVACLPAHGRVRPSPSAAPLLLAQICRHWRGVALATTELWSSLDIEMIHGSRRTAIVRPGNPSLYELWFSRANKRPLALTIHQPDPWDDRSFEHDKLPPFFFALVPRLGRLEADISASQLARLIPSHRSLSLTNLEHLAAPVGACDLPTLLQRVPKLKTLHIREAPSADAVSRLSLPTLTSLHIEFAYAPITLSMFFEILRRCPLLEHFRGAVKSSPACAEKHITLSTLTSFELKGGDIGVFELITLPNLRTLLFSARDRSEGTVEIIRPFLVRSSCAVTQLTLTEASMASDTQKCIELFPTVERLELCSGFHDFNCDSFPVLKGNDLAHMPRLRELTLGIYVDDYLKVNHEDIYKLVAHRHKDPSLVPLEKFHLRIRDEEYESMGDAWFPSKLQAIRLKRILPEFSVELATFDENELTTTVSRWPEGTLSDPCVDFCLNPDMEDEDPDWELDSYDSEGYPSDYSYDGYPSDYSF
ncbi:hypothetical protein C8F01DRAFT_1022329 [Mycena amicta]|nr:hypothetical protein C8F01DRAFT_1022329 [Mycena amicta]